MGRKILGLDIRRDGVSAVFVKSGMKGSWVESHLRVPISVKETSFEEELGKAIEIIHTQMDIADAVCIVALPAIDMAYRNLTAPFKEIKKVKILVAGNEYKTLSGHLDLENPYFPDYKYFRR